MDLLQRTVFYKVGHHGSHNATGKKSGLEQINSNELVAMIPVDESVALARGKRGWKMPAKDLYTRLMEKTKGRIIRIDQGNVMKQHPETIPQSARPTEKQKETFYNALSSSKAVVTGDDGKFRPLYWEYTVKS